MIGVWVLFFIFGAVIGSFLNVVIFRLNTGRSLGGRSGCFTCGKTLRWYELIPLVSFYVQKGRCRGCQAKISWQYPVVEATTAFLFLLTAMKFWPFLPLIVFWWLALSLLIVIAFYDLRHQIIPDSMVYTLIALGIFKPFLISWPVEIISAGTDILAGVIFFLFFASLWYFSRGKWMGLGDGKLALALGILLGWSGGFSALVLAFWIGAVVGLLLIGLNKIKIPRRLLLSSVAHSHYFTLKSEIPFAPFMILGLILNLIFGIDVLYLF